MFLTALGTTKGRPGSARRSQAAGRILLALALLLGVAAAADAEEEERLLERVDARVERGQVEIVIGTTRRLRYVSHVLAEGGRVLQIQLVPEEPAVASNGVGQLPWTGSAEVPLLEVSSQSSGATAALILHFSVAVDPRAVRANPDDRSVVVTLAPPPAPLQAARRGGIYAVNLASWGAEGPIDPAAVAAAGPGVVLYQIRTRVRDSLRFRLRAGFFDSAESAQAAVARFAGIFPDAWVSEIAAPERDRVQAGERLVDLSRLMVKPETDASLPAVSLDRLTEMTDEARSAAANADWTRAGLLYERIAAYAVAPYQQDARELAGVVQEKAGRLAQAAALYKSYLVIYPAGEAAERVRQRLSALGAPAPESGSIAVGGAAGRAQGWETFGSFSQFYSHDLLTAGTQSNESVRALLSSDVDFNARQRAESYDLRVRLTGGYDRDFLDAGRSEWHASTAYLDFATRDQLHLGRLGRQTRSSGGVLGRFDGLYYGYRLAPGYRLNAVGGLPVDFSSGSPDTSRLFYGLSLDLGPVARRWNFNVFAVNQTVGGLVDRRAVGGEARYALGSSTAFGLFDYDVEFKSPNVLYFIGSTTFGESTTVSLVADRRKNPLLSARNALVGQSATTIDDLGRSYTAEQLRQLALDRTATSTTYSAALIRLLSTRWRLSTDVTMTQLGGTAASGGVDAFPRSGPDWYYNLQLLGSDLFRPEDYGTVGLRYTNATNYRATGVLGQYRLRVGTGLLLNPRLRVDYRETTAGATQWLYVPVIRASHALDRKWSLELEASAEFLDERFSGVRDQSRLYLLYLGYRYEF